MNFKEFVTLSGLSQAETARILETNPVTISRRFNNPNSEPTYSEIIKVENATGKQLYFNDNISSNKEYDQVSIKYLRIPGIPEEILRSPLVKERVQFDKEIVNAIRRCSEHQRVVKMRGDKMSGGGYPLYDGDILIIDISERNVAKSGVYLYTTDLPTGREVFISNVNVRPDGNYRLSYFNDKYQEVIYTPSEIKEMKFTVWGRVIIDLMFTL